ncbi:MAG TPA: phytanoyl-CoA dioxygenase family protein [Blastocatellia bacterium]|jgi:ectoine hydroxylase
MRLTDEQFAAYQENGFVLLPEYFSKQEVELLRAELPAVLNDPGPGRIVEKEGGAVRSVYGSHTTNDLFKRLARHPRIVEPAKQVLGTDVYVYQFKINVKAGFGGDVWQWHQDFPFWRNEDGMTTEQVTNIAIFLDEVNEFNAPMFLIPGSHREGVIEVKARAQAAAANGSNTYRASPGWLSNVTADLKYSLDKETVTRLVKEHGITSPKGPAGSALIFHCNLAHASSNNISPFDRVLVFITFNSTRNVPVAIENPRPDFLASRNHSPVVPLLDNALLQ